MEKNPKDKFSLEQDLACSASEYAYENEDTDFECVAKIKMTNEGATAEIIDGFTLTAEEVEMVIETIFSHIHYYLERMCPKTSPYIKEREECNNLLTRIKQWEDDNSEK